MTFSINCFTDDFASSPATDLYYDKLLLLCIHFDPIFHTNIKCDASSLGRRLWSCSDTFFPSNKHLSFLTFVLCLLSEVKCLKFIAVVHIICSLKKIYNIYSGFIHHLGEKAVVELAVMGNNSRVNFNDGFWTRKWKRITFVYTKCYFRKDGPILHPLDMYFFLMNTHSSTLRKVLLDWDALCEFWALHCLLRCECCG